MAGSIDTADHNSFPFAEFNYRIQLIQINEFPITALSFNLPLYLYVRHPLLWILSNGGALFTYTLSRVWHILFDLCSFIVENLIWYINKNCDRNCVNLVIFIYFLIYGNKI
jgi:hypothetical protein